MNTNTMKSSRSLIIVLFIILSGFFLCGGCNREKADGVILESKIISDVAGSAGIQTPVLRDTQGNPFGYYEYLPPDFDSDKKFPLIFYWNGANAISGNGREDITSLLDQGLPELINNGKKYPAIIISAQLENWKKDNVKPFFDYILRRYNSVIDSTRIYMTGFSAGGGITLRFAAKYPTELSAILPIAPAVWTPKWNTPMSKIGKLPTWIFHNSGDDVVSPEISKKWHDALHKYGDRHHLTLYDAEGHYAWQETYANPNVWKWLFQQTR